MTVVRDQANAFLHPIRRLVVHGMGRRHAVVQEGRGMSNKGKNSREDGKREKLRKTRSKMDIMREVAYIIGRAVEREPRLVTLGPLVFFSTGSGDAWMLDPADGFSIWLACGGTPLSYRIEETPESFAVGWDRHFQIEDGVFITTDQSGQVTSFAGYPTESILEAIR
jgi:hypothetical protein